MHVLIKPSFLLYYTAFYFICLYQLLEGVYTLHEASVSGKCWKCAHGVCNLCDSWAGKAPQCIWGGEVFIYVACFVCFYWGCILMFLANPLMGRKWLAQPWFLCPPLGQQVHSRSYQGPDLPRSMCLCSCCILMRAAPCSGSLTQPQLCWLWHERWWEYVAEKHEGGQG